MSIATVIFPTISCLALLAGTQATRAEALPVLFAALSSAPGIKPGTQQVLNIHFLNEAMAQGASPRVTEQCANSGFSRAVSEQGCPTALPLHGHSYSTLFQKGPWQQQPGTPLPRERAAVRTGSQEVSAGRAAWNSISGPALCPAAR